MKKNDQYQYLFASLKQADNIRSSASIFADFLRKELKIDDFSIIAEDDSKQKGEHGAGENFFLYQDQGKNFYLALHNPKDEKAVLLVESVVHLFRIHTAEDKKEKSIPELIERLKHFYSNFPGLLTVLNEEGKYEYVNDFTMKHLNGANLLSRKNGMMNSRDNETSFTVKNKEILDKGYVMYPDFYVDQKGTLRNFENHAFLVEENGKKWIVVLGIDITEKVHLEGSLRDMAFNDSLTNLYNYNYFIKRVTELLHESRTFSLFYIDINRFRKINEVYGFEVGDKVLNHFVSMIQHFIMRKNMHEHIIPFRFKDDEFIIIFNNIEKEKVHNLANEMMQFISSGVVINDILYKLDYVAGVSSFPEDGIIKETLIRKAAIAKNRAKESQETNLVIFSKELEEEIKREYEIESRIHSALNRNEFELYLQPIISRKNRKIIKAEALIRWNHPNLGLVGPVDFIPVAEKSNLILKIGEWVLEEACKILKKWELKNIQTPISINVSGKQLLQYNFSELVENMITRYDVEPVKLIFEITESYIFEEEQEIKDSIRKLSSLGIVFSIDDFGTGYSTMLKLKHINFTEIKIDRSFINGLMHNDTDAFLVKNIISLATDLGLDIVAEGVEDAEQYAYLSELGCDFFQGFLFSRAIRLKDFEYLLLADPEKIFDKLTLTPAVDGHVNTSGVSRSKYFSQNMADTALNFDCKQILDQLASSVIITDPEGRIEYVNRRFVELSGYLPEEVIGQNPRMLSSGLIPNNVFKNLWETILAGKEWQGELHNRRKNRDTYWQQARITPLINKGKIEFFIAILEDITEKKSYEKRLRYLAKIDPMTGALNRAVGMEFLELFFDEGIINKDNITLIFIDMDNLKEINDVYGHNRGDEAIKIVADIIKKNIRKDCLFVRYGGDEFLIVVRDIDTINADFIINRLHIDLDIKSREFVSPIRISVGVSNLGEIKGDNLDEMIKRADNRMYQDKNEKKRKYNGRR